jgi:hypothetical protein
MRIDTKVTTARDNWGQFATQMDSAVADAMQNLSAEGARYAEGMAPPALAGTFFHWPSGRLAWSWGSDHQWAQGLDQGIPPHLIGRPGQFLYNRQEGTGPGGAGHFRAKGPVMHPGVQPSEFMARSFAAIEPDIMPELREEVSRSVRGY